MSTQHRTHDHNGNGSYCRFGSETLSKLIQVLEAQNEGVKKAEDIEYVHKMRVTSRRIRATMPLFKECCPKKRFKEWLEEIRKVTQFLGEARDLDVQIDFIQNYIKETETEEIKEGLQPFLGIHKERRANLQPNVIRELEKLKSEGILQAMEKYFNQTKDELANEPWDSNAVLEKAFWHILSKLDDFMAMKNCVHRENYINRHHEMRIRAKWLRYTMEVFSGLYESKLFEEIEMMKNFQDLLGEMHDATVWITEVPKFMNQYRKEQEKTYLLIDTTEQALTNFLEYIRKKRKENYTDFVKLWDEKKDKNAFEQLKKTVGDGLAIESIKGTTLSLDAKIAVLADVHANLDALKSVIADAEQHGANVFLNAGDLTGFGPFPNEVIHLLYSKHVLSVVGNYDLEVLGRRNKEELAGEKKLAHEFVKKELSKSCAAYLRALPKKATFEIDGKKILMVHGSPVSIEEHIYHDTPEDRLRKLAKKAGADMVLVGHSHDQFMREVNGVFFINPGSVGRPGDGNPRAAYSMISFNPFHVELLRVSYDVEAAADALRRKNLPESFEQMLLQGLSLGDIIKEDKLKQLEIEKKCMEMSKVSKSVAQKYWRDTAHSMQVMKLSLILFDGLSGLHKLEKRERCWLECAAILHDIGLSRGTSGHHKASTKLILNDTQLPFSSNDRRIIGSIVRYHRKGFPKDKHYNLKTLSRLTKQKISIQSGILRVADGLDYTHQSLVEKLEVIANPESITITCLVRSDPAMEEQAVNEKKDLMEKCFKRKVLLAWKKN